jgi:hypothetical protein
MKQLLKLAAFCCIFYPPVLSAQKNGVSLIDKKATAATKAFDYDLEGEVVEQCLISDVMMSDFF